MEYDDGILNSSGILSLPINIQMGVVLYINEMTTALFISQKPLLTIQMK